MVRAMESFGLAWSVRDIAVALSAFQVAYPRMRQLLHESGSKGAMVELGHLASTYRTAKGSLDSARLTDNLRGIASELHSISSSEAGEMFCIPRADLSLTDAILRGKMVYYMLPRLEEAESAARMVKVFREDLEVSIGEVTSSRSHKLEDPHLVIIDEGASTFGPTWANLFELARKGRFALIFGAQSVGGLMDQTMGLSEEFYERVMANVNLKVIMRVGDNRTAEDMSEWIGMVKTAKKSLAAGISTSLSAREWTKHIEINKKSADAHRDGVTVAEDEEELVSTEELKHEMSAEKGLAWFDKGDGVVRKGRTIWFDSELPGTWEGREFLTKYESVEADEIGLAEWVDEHIFSIEEAETERAAQGLSPSDSFSPPPGPAGASAVATSSASPSGSPTEEEPEDTGPFRLNPFRPFRGRTRANTVITRVEPKPELKATPEAKEHNKEAVAESAAPPAVAPVAEQQTSTSSPLVTTPTSERNQSPASAGASEGTSSLPRGVPRGSEKSANGDRRDERSGEKNSSATTQKDRSTAERSKEARAPQQRSNAERGSNGEQRSNGERGSNGDRGSRPTPPPAAPATNAKESRKDAAPEKPREEGRGGGGKPAPKGNGGGQKPHKQGETKPSGSGEQFRFRGTKRDTIVQGKKN